ncbi:stage II sporulation protein P [Halanaerobacter jeridensis]|uniref:Stage II sporulation protein P n=1 Tax=Halanaerobacter jeridensis TaxID=706427 RepID=A0A938XNY7_9FIRM|nr:stage II sporulation protein P [Halanaerobacter jeridensis]MBM7556017.1 stage II sporulation protein P [Halanaerobacter jeridensis]
MKSKKIIIVVIFIILFNLILITKLQAEEVNHFTVVDKQGQTIFETAMEVSKGDYYINEENKKYKVIKVNGKKGIAKFIAKVDLLEDDKLLTSSQGLLAQGAKKLVAIYNTHSDESYKPTSGSHSEPGGGDVYKIAASFANALENKGVNVIQDKSKHDPHDGGAYERSRRTAVKLIKKRPDALFDIHRDGVANPQEYVTEINGKRIAKIRLVIGRQNPQLNVNSKFAKQVKAVTDQKYPGLIKGIFYAKGKYNQDLSPRSLLIEAGTHVISQDMAVSSINLLADTINDLLYGKNSEKAKSEQNSSSISSIFIILLVVSVVGGFLYIANKRGVIDKGFSDSMGIEEKKETIEDLTNIDDSDD